MEYSLHRNDRAGNTIENRKIMAEGISDRLIHRKRLTKRG